MNKPNQWRAAARSVQERRRRESVRRAVEHRAHVVAVEQVRLLVR